jgi:hypothetical protein
MSTTTATPIPTPLTAVPSTQLPTAPTTPGTPPPPAYTPNSNIPVAQPATNLPYDPNPNSNFTFNPFAADPEDDSEDGDPSSVLINASTQIRGTGNVVAIPLVDAPRISAALFAVLKAQSAVGVARRGAINVQIHCGVTLVGDRNVVGLTGMGSRTKAAATTTTTTTTITTATGAPQRESQKAQKPAEDEGEGVVGGTKRKAEDVRSFYEDIATTFANRTRISQPQQPKLSKSRMHNSDLLISDVNSVVSMQI